MSDSITNSCDSGYTSNSSNYAGKPDPLQEYNYKIQVEKNKLMEAMSKEQLTDLVFQQNQMFVQQNKKLNEMIIAAQSEQNKPNDTVNKNGDNAANNTSEIINNNLCLLKNRIMTEQIILYERYFQIQMILFVLLLLVLVWFLWTYTSDNKN